LLLLLIDQLSDLCLQIRTLPTVVCFVDGISKQRIIGFEGLADGMPPGKEDEWTTDRVRCCLAGCCCLFCDFTSLTNPHAACCAFVQLIRLLGNLEMIDLQNIEGDTALTPAQRLAEMRMAMMRSLDDDDLDLDGDGDDDI